MPTISKYLEFCKEANSAEKLTTATYEFLEKQGGEVTLIEHTPTPNPLKVLQTNTDKTLDDWCKSFNNLDTRLTTKHVSNGNHDYYFSHIDFHINPIFLFTVKDFPPANKEVLTAWQSLVNFQKNIHHYSKLNTENLYGNLISQFMHDIQSLIDSNKSTDAEIIKRIKYQKKLNKDLLFFIRDFDLFKTEISIKSFINDSLKLIDLEPEAIKTEIEDEDLKIDVDVELFAETFNVVIDNAMKATEKNLSKISVKTYSRPSGSPFFKQDWIVFEISDQGNGIPEEFEPFVSNPFFTTHKHDGHTGFGLTNAKKIIKAHRGFLEIRTGNGTTVKIFLPQKSHEKK